MRYYEYFKRMFEIIYIFAAGLIMSTEQKHIERGSRVPLKIAAGDNK